MASKVIKYRNKINKVQEEQFKEELFNTSNKQVIDKLNQEINISNIFNASLHIDKYQNNTSIILSVEDYYEKYDLMNGFFVRKDNIVDINMTFKLNDLINDNQIPEFINFEQILKNTITILKLVKSKKLHLTADELELNILHKFIFEYLK